MADIGEIREQVLTGVDQLTAPFDTNFVYRSIEPVSGSITPSLDLSGLVEDIAAGGNALQAAKDKTEAFLDAVTSNQSNIDAARSTFSGLETTDPRIQTVIELLGQVGSRGQDALLPHFSAIYGLLGEAEAARKIYAEKVWRCMQVIGSSATGAGAAHAAQRLNAKVEEAVDLAMDYQNGL